MQDFANGLGSVRNLESTGFLVVKDCPPLTSGVGSVVVTSQLRELKKPLISDSTYPCAIVGALDQGLIGCEKKWLII